MTENQEQTRGRKGAPDIYVEEGEVLTLSPDSKAFRRAYRRVQPQSIDEVREVIGLTPEFAEVRRRRICCPPEALDARVVSLEELEADDPDVRARARALAVEAGRHYVATGDPAMVVWKPVMDRYVQLTGAHLQIATFGDIVVADRATLNVSASTSSVWANTVKLYGTGTIALGGPTTFRVQSFEGKIGLHLPPIGILTERTE